MVLLSPMNLGPFYENELFFQYHFHRIPLIKDEAPLAEAKV